MARDAQKPVLKPSSSKRQGDPMAEIREQHEREFRTRITGPVTSGAIKWEKISKLGTRRTTERKFDKPNVNVKDTSNSKSETLPWSEQSAVGKGKSRDNKEVADTEVCMAEVLPSLRLI